MSAVLEQEVVDWNKIARLEKFYEKTLPKMQAEFVMEILEGAVAEEDMQEQCELYEMSFEAAYYAAAVFRMGGDAKGEQLRKLKRVIDENVSTGFEIISVVHRNRVATILLLEEEKYLNRAIWEIEQVCRHAGKFLGGAVTVGIGQVVENRSQLSQSWRSALDAVEYCLLLGNGRVVSVSDIQFEKDKSFDEEERFVSQLLKDIKIGDENSLKEDVRELTEQFRKKQVSFQHYQIVMMELVAELLKLARSYQVDLTKFLDGDTNIYQKVLQFTSLMELEQWLLSIAFGLRTTIRREKRDSAKLLVDSAKQFIHENYSDSDLSVEVLCKHLNVSATYFSTIFKKETGKNFVAYLTDVRMDAARELLNNTEDKTYIISAKVGYPEPNYFSYVFKKQYGIAPSQYRASIKK